MSIWDDVRRDFPVTERYAYLDSAGTGPTPRVVRETVEAFHRSLEEHGELAWPQWMERREHIRGKVAELIGAHADEIAFVPNTSTGMNLIADLVGSAGAVVS